MELGLSLGDGSTTVGLLKGTKSTGQDPKPTAMNGLDFCMALGLSSANREPAVEKAREIDDDDGDEDEDEISQGDDDESDDNRGKNPLLQLNLLPLAPVNPRRRISSHRRHSLPWSSDNGSSENGSSGNVPAAVRGLDVNRLPAPPAAAATEEVSSANSVGSPLFHMDIGVYRNSNIDGNLVLGGGKKRSSDFDAAAGNDAGEAERASSRASDDDENGVNARKKLRLSKQQSAFLEESFKEHNTLNPKQKLALAKQLNLRPRQVEVWFQNRRARTKLKQTEVDCEYLKRCCETLTEENRRLHKELQELRALKTSNPFYMQSPATTLTMCPSCERVATAAAPPPPTTAGDCASVPFPLIRPRFHPFSQTATRPNNQPAAS